MNGAGGVLSLLAPTMDHEDESQILEHARAGQIEGVGQLLESYWPRLARMIAVRMDPRIKRRVDASDILQATFVDVTRRLATYFEREDIPFFVWVRFLALQKLTEYHRRHLGTAARDAGAEASGVFSAGPMASSIRMAQVLADSGPTPSGVAILAEQRAQLEDALADMAEADREVLALRHFEKLSNVEAAQILGITESGASRRHMRALERLRGVLAGIESTIGRVEPDAGGDR